MHICSWPVNALNSILNFFKSALSCLVTKAMSSISYLFKSCARPVNATSVEDQQQADAVNQLGTETLGVASTPSTVDTAEQEAVDSSEANTAEKPAKQEEVDSSEANTAEKPAKQEEVDSSEANTAEKPAKQEKVDSSEANTAEKPAKQEKVVSSPASSIESDDESETEDDLNSSHDIFSTIINLFSPSKK